MSTMPKKKSREVLEWKLGNSVAYESTTWRDDRAVLVPWRRKAGEETGKSAAGKRKNSMLACSVRLEALVSSDWLGSFGRSACAWFLSSRFKGPATVLGCHVAVVPLFLRVIFNSLIERDK